VDWRGEINNLAFGSGSHFGEKSNEDGVEEKDGGA